MCNSLLSKGPKVTVMYSSPTSLISSASYFNLVGRTFLWGAKWWRDWILGPCDSVSSPNRGLWSAVDTALLNGRNGDSFKWQWRFKQKQLTKFWYAKVLVSTIHLLPFLVSHLYLRKLCFRSTGKCEEESPKTLRKSKSLHMLSSSDASTEENLRQISV